MTRSPSPRSARWATLAVAALATGGAAAGSVLVAGPASAAETPTVTISQSAADAIRPLCRTAYDLVRDDVRLPDGISRNVAVAACLQLYRSTTRLSASSNSAPAPDAGVPPLKGESIPPPIRVVVAAAPTPSKPTPPGPTTPTSAPPVLVPVPIPVPIGVPVPVPAGPPPPAPASPAPGGGPPAPGAAPGGATAGAAPAAGALPGPGSALDSGLSSTPIGAGTAAPSDPAPTDPAALPAPAPGAPLPGAPLPGAAATSAPGVDPLAPGAPVETLGLPGTVSDPTTSTVAEASRLDNGGGLSAALVAGVLGAVALVALLAREVAVHGMPRPLAAVLRRGDRPADAGLTDATGVTGTRSGADGSDTALSAGGFVQRWLHWGDVGPREEPDEDAVATDPVGIAPVPDDDRPTGVGPALGDDPAVPGDPANDPADDPAQARPYSFTKRSSTTLATWPPGDPNG